VDNAWYADGLVPITNDKPFYIPNSKNRIPGQKNHAVYIDIFVPQDVKSDTYQSKLHLTANGKHLHTLQISLKVLPFSLPSTPSFTLELLNWGGTFTTYKFPYKMPKERKKFLAHRNTKRFDTGLFKYHRLAKEHYTCMTMVPYNLNAYYSRSMAPRLDKLHRISDFREYDRKFSPFLSGKAFTRGYGKDVPVSIFILPFSLDWPAPFTWFPSDVYTDAITQATRAFESHFRKNGWTRTRYQLMLIHKERKCKFPYNCDEPTRIKDYGMLQYYGRAFKKGQNFKKGLIDYRFDVGHYECTCIMDKCDWLPGEIRCSHTNQLDNITGINIVSYCHSSRKSFARRKRIGEKMWHYEGASWVNRPLTEMRQLLLKSYSFGFEGFCDWHVHGWDPKINPWKSMGKSYGSTYLFYPGKEVGIDEPLPCLRLKMARRAVIDIEYMEIIRKKKKAGVQNLLSNMLEGYDPDKASLMDVTKPHKLPIIPSKPYAWESFRSKLIRKILKG
jgi:hypothetical protein